jgi:hypothetical protein
VKRTAVEVVKDSDITIPLCVDFEGYRIIITSM